MCFSINYETLILVRLNSHLLAVCRARAGVCLIFPLKQRVVLKPHCAAIHRSIRSDVPYGLDFFRCQTFNILFLDPRFTQQTAKHHD